MSEIIGFALGVAYLCVLAFYCVLWRRGMLLALIVVRQVCGLGWVGRLLVVDRWRRLAPCWVAGGRGTGGDGATATPSSKLRKHRERERPEAASELEVGIGWS